MTARHEITLTFQKYVLMIERLKNTMERMRTQEHPAVPKSAPTTPKAEAAKIHRVG